MDTYLVGGEMVFTRCVDGYTLRGETHYTCVQVSDEEAEWSPEPDVHCKCRFRLGGLCLNDH